MSFLAWMALTGALLLTMALSSAWLQRLPVSTAALYLALGAAIGPWGFDLLRIDLTTPGPWLERFTEIAVIIALFIGGLKLRLPLRHPLWQPAYRLASIMMLVCILGVAALAWAAFDLPPALALLVGAILAPTDPVLAGAVTVGHADDRNPLKFALSGEAGLNDGAAFPFIILALLLLSPEFVVGDLAGWTLHRLLWAVPAGLGLGYLLGRLVGQAAIALRAKNRDTAAPTDFLALALIALSYTGAEAIGAWGFLATFAAGVGLRHAEVLTVREAPHPDAPQDAASSHPPAETLVSATMVTEEEMGQPAVAAGVLVAEIFSFGDAIERLLEVFLVVLVGVALATHWDWRGFVLGAVLFAAIRPLATFLCLIGTQTSLRERGLIGWFGIRGIGSLYYLAFALSHGLSGSAADEVADLTLCVVAASICVHGLTSQSLMEWHEARTARKSEA